HGLETAIAEGWVRDAAGLRDWVEGLLEQGSGWTDAVLFRAAWAGEEAAELAEALTPSAERRRETLHLREAFQAAIRPWASAPAGLQAYLPGKEDRVACRVAAGRACGGAGLPLELSLTAFLHAFAGAQVSVAVRAIPIGQGEAVAVLAALEPLVLRTAARAAASTLDDLGACAVRADIAAMRHETLQPRLFLS